MKRKRGLTLIELLVWIAIVAIVASIALPLFGVKFGGYNDNYEFKGYLPYGAKVYVDKRTGQEFIVPS